MPQALPLSDTQPTEWPPSQPPSSIGRRSRTHGRHARVSKNLRHHLEKSMVRLGVLLAVDLSAVYLGRMLLRAMRIGDLGEGLGHAAGTLLPNAAVSAPQLALAVVIALLAFGSYRSGDLWRDPIRIVMATGVGVSIALYGSLWQEHPGLVLLRGVVIWGALAMVLVAYRNSVYVLSRRLPRPGLQQRVLEIHEPGLLSEIDLGPRYQLLATLDSRDLPGDIEEMEDWLEGGVDTILVSCALPAERFAQVVDFALSHGCHLLTTPRSAHLIGVDPNRIWIRGMPLTELTAPSLRASQLVLKRALDLAAGSVLLTLLSPLMLLISIAVKLDSPGPVLFKHRRAGLGGRFFRLLKFRSMRADAEQVLRSDLNLYRRYVENNFKLPEAEDPRITRLGRFLRKTSLDELPQLLNVIKGDMSLVGPRPVVEPELEMYRGHIPTFLSVKPGVTGLWQVSGRSDVGFPERAEMDLEYVRRWSLLKDLWILLMTGPTVLMRTGAH